MNKKLTLTIEKYGDDRRDLNIRLKENFYIQIGSSPDGKIKKVKLKVTRNGPDEHSTTLGMYAYLHNNEKGYENLGFPSVSLTIDTYSDANKFVSRKILDFPNAKVDSRLMRGDVEELVFISDSIKEFEISKVEVFFD